MERSERLEVAKMLAATSELYGKKPFSPDGDALKLYILALAPYTVAEISRALSTHVRYSPFMPRPADIVALIQGSIDDRGRLAWRQVAKAIDRHGEMESVTFLGPDAPAIHYAIENMGGWIHLCGKLEDKNEDFVCQDFLVFFRNAISRGVNWNSVSTVLNGRHYLNNKPLGYSTPIYVIRTEEQHDERIDRTALAEVIGIPRIPEDKGRREGPAQAYQEGDNGGDGGRKPRNLEARGVSSILEISHPQVLQPSALPSGAEGALEAVSDATEH